MTRRDAHRIGRRGIGALLAPLSLLSACYVYVPPARPEAGPGPGTSVALDLNDQGRIGLGASLGPEVRRISGRLLAGSDSAYAISVTQVETLRGEKTTWTGERLDVRRAFVGSVLERRLSRSRTALVAGTAVAAVGAFVLTRTLGGSAAGGEGGAETNPPPATTTRVLPPRPAAP